MADGLMILSIEECALVSGGCSTGTFGSGGRADDGEAGTASPESLS